MYGIFLEHQLKTEETWDVTLLGYRFDAFREALFCLEEIADMAGGKVEEFIDSDGDIEFYWSVPPEDLPDGYDYLVYKADEINEYDLEHYAI